MVRRLAFERSQRPDATQALTRTTQKCSAWTATCQISSCLQARRGWMRLTLTWISADRRTSSQRTKKWLLLAQRQRQQMRASTTRARTKAAAAALKARLQIQNLISFYVQNDAGRDGGLLCTGRAGYFSLRLFGLLALTVRKAHDVCILALWL